MAGLSLRCGDCGAQLRSVEEAQAHAEATNHANFVESTEAVLNLVCSDCGKPCRSQTVRSSTLRRSPRFRPVGFGDPVRRTSGGSRSGSDRV
jgi:DNA-directed RNA polymerase subunit RPC12/RpoP